MSNPHPINSAAYWDEEYKREYRSGKRRIDHHRYDFLVGEIRAWEEIGGVPARPRFLDVGCGDGELLRMLHVDFPWWFKFGIDIASETIERNREHTRCFIYHAMSVHDLDWHHSVDIIWCGETLEHLQGPELAVARMYDALEVGGLLIITVPNEHDNPSPEHVCEYTVADCLKLTEKVGPLRNVVVKGESTWRSICWSTIKR